MKPVSQRRAASWLIKRDWPESNTTPPTHTVDTGSPVGGWAFPCDISWLVAGAHIEGLKRLTGRTLDVDKCTRGKISGDNCHVAVCLHREKEVMHP